MKRKNIRASIIGSTVFVIFGAVVASAASQANTGGATIARTCEHTVWPYQCITGGDDRKVRIIGASIDAARVVFAGAAKGDTPERSGVKGDRLPSLVALNNNFVTVETRLTGVSILSRVATNR